MGSLSVCIIGKPNKGIQQNRKSDKRYTAKGRSGNSKTGIQQNREIRNMYTAKGIARKRRPGENWCLPGCAKSVAQRLAPRIVSAIFKGKPICAFISDCVFPIKSVLLVFLHMSFTSLAANEI